MKTHTITTYSAPELKAQFPTAFKRALEHYRDTNHEIAWQDETIDSLKALLERAGVTLRDWSLGAYNRGNHISVTFPGSYDEDTEALSGPRAIAWLENNLYAGVRIPWKGEKRASVRKYGKFYYPGLIAPCPFTGYCADEDYIAALNKAVCNGDTLKEAFEGLADTCQSLLESDAESQNTEEYFEDMADCNDWQFTEDGELFN